MNTQPDHPNLSVPPRPLVTLPEVVEGLKAIGTSVLVIAAAGVAFALVCAVPRRTAGATRSTKLRWQERQQQIDEAMVREQTQQH